MAAPADEAGPPEDAEMAEAAPAKVEAEAAEPSKEADAADGEPEKAAEAEAEKAAEGKEGGGEEKDLKKPRLAKKAQELEQDAPEDARPRHTGHVSFQTTDTTPNVMLTAGGNVMMALTEGGFQYLLAGARANVGLTAGRYMFEVVILETLGANGAAAQKQDQQKQPQQVVRVGFAVDGAPLLLSEQSVDSVCFNSEGLFLHGKAKSKISQRFGRDQVVAVVLNLEPGSPNANTISLFRDGRRVTPPQKLPEALVGRPLLPAVNFRGVTLKVNFGPVPLKPLPFRCRMLQDTSAADCFLPGLTPAPGGPEVLFPVGLPDEGVAHWVGQFLAKNPGYVELSGRALLEWGKSSGLWRKGGKGSNDRPEMGFGIEQLDDMSVLSFLSDAGPALGRSLVVAEVQGNLLAERRRAALAAFEGCGFKRTAVVFMGEPPEDYRESVRRSLLEEKRRKQVAEAAKKRAEAERKKAAEAKRPKGKEGAKEEGATKGGAAAEGAAAAQEAGQKPAKEEVGKGTEAAVEDEVKVELTEEEQQAWFKKTPLPDLTQQEMAKSFASFSLPEAAEGFDEVRFEWQPEARCDAYLKEWILKRKATQRVEDIEPSKWFKEKLAEWKKALQDWRSKQAEWKKVLEQLQEWKKEGKKTGEEDKKDGDDKPTEIDAEDLDVFKVEDINDVGSGEPLFAKFGPGEWALLERRFELHLLAYAFRRDIDDPDRPTFHESHLGFYYSRYYKKPFDLKMFTCSSSKDFTNLVKDTVGLRASDGMLVPQLAEDTPLDNFIKLAEEDRRDRQRRLDAGDETAELKYVKPLPAAPQATSKTPTSSQQSWQRTQRAPPPPPSRQGTTRASSGGGYGAGTQRDYGSGGASSWRGSSSGGTAAAAAGSTTRRESWQAPHNRSGATTRSSSGGGSYQQPASRSTYTPAATSRSYHAPATSARQAYGGGGGGGASSAGAAGTKRITSYSSGAAPAKQARTGSYSSYGSGGGGRW